MQSHTALAWWLEDLKTRGTNHLSLAKSQGMLLQALGLMWYGGGRSERDPPLPLFNVPLTVLVVFLDV